jgi:hypothetical protein
MKSKLLIAIGIVFAILASVTFFPSPHAQVRKSLVFLDAFDEEGAPFQLGTVTHTTNFLLDKAEVTNTLSDRTIRSITFGAVLHESGPVGTEPVFISTHEISTNIKPGETRSLDILELPAKEGRELATRFKSNSVVVEFGVTNVQFDDGSTWGFDIKKYGTFTRPTAQSSAVRPSQSLHLIQCTDKATGLSTLLSKIMPTAFAQTIWACGPINSKAICSVNLDGEGCANRTCTHSMVVNGTCPDTICKID